MENSFAEKLAVRSVNQRVGSKNLVQPGKWSAGGQDQAAPREFQPLFLQIGLQFADRAASSAPRLGLHPGDEFAGLVHQHFPCRVIRLPEFVAERIYKVEALPRPDNQPAFFETHGDKRGPPRMRAKANRCLFRMSHCENLLLRLYNFPHNFRISSSG